MNTLNKYNISLVFLSSLLLSSCSLIFPNIPPYEKDYVGVCRQYSLVDSNGLEFNTIGLNTFDNTIVLFVGRNASYSEGQKYAQFIGQTVNVNGLVYPHNGSMLYMKDRYIGFSGWQGRSKTNSDIHFETLSVKSITLMKAQETVN